MMIIRAIQQLAACTERIKYVASDQEKIFWDQYIEIVGGECERTWKSNMQYLVGKEAARLFWLGCME